MLSVVLKTQGPYLLSCPGVVGPTLTQGGLGKGLSRVQLYELALMFMQEMLHDNPQKILNLYLQEGSLALHSVMMNAKMEEYYGYVSGIELLLKYAALASHTLW